MNLRQLFRDSLNPMELTKLIFSPLEEGCILQLNPTLNDEDVKDVLFLRFCKTLLDEVLKEPVKLTQKGNLPRKVVHQMYDYRYYTSSYIDEGRGKLLKETDFYQLHLAHVLLKMGGVVRKYRNKLSVTKKGAKIKAQDNQLFTVLLNTYVNKLNWSYMSYYEDKIAQYGWGFIMYLFLKYGDKERPVSFYEKLYLEVLPEMFQEVPQNNPYVNPKERFSSNFEGKFFGRFCNLFKLVDFNKEKNERGFFKTVGLKKTPLLDKTFMIKKAIPRNVFLWN